LLLPIAWYKSWGPVLPAAESAYIVIPGRNVAGSQPYFPEVPGLTVAALPNPACAPVPGSPAVRSPVPGDGNGPDVRCNPGQPQATPVDFQARRGR